MQDISDTVHGYILGRDDKLTRYNVRCLSPKVFVV